MKTITCDRCGCELKETTAFGVVIGGTIEETFDLCGECREALIDWLANGKEQEKKPGKKADDPYHDDPDFGAPKNDKVGYTLSALEPIVHRHHETIKKALADMKVEPARWTRGKRAIVRYYLGRAELTELKKRLGAK